MTFDKDETSFSVWRFLDGVFLLPPASKGWAKVLFSEVCVCSHPGEVPPSTDGGYSHPSQQVTPPPPPIRKDGVSPTPCQDWMGVTLLPVGRRSSIASACYAAGGMPLAFMQEDFLVYRLVYNANKGFSF